MTRTANHPAFDNVIVIDRRDPGPSRRPRRGRHRRPPTLLVRACSALALCGATACAATAVVVWVAPSAQFEVPAVFTDSGAIGSSVLELEVREPAADAVPAGPGAGDEPGAGATVPVGPDRPDPNGTESEKAPR